MAKYIVNGESVKLIELIRNNPCLFSAWKYNYYLDIPGSLDQKKPRDVTRLISLHFISFGLVICRYMYYSSVGVNLQIYRADMDGKNQMILANLSFVGDDTFVDLVLDKPNNRLLFSDQTNEVIRYINLTNLEIHTVLSGNLHKPTSLTKLNDTLYWTASGDGTFSGAVFKADVTSNSASPQTVADGFGQPKGIYAYSSLATQGS